MLEFFTGRSNRQEYWISVALLIVVAVVLSVFQMQAASVAITIMWVITWVRRLHDVNLSGWYAGAPILLLLILIFAAVAFGGKEFVAIVQALQANDPNAIPKSDVAFLMGFVLIAAVIQFGFTIWLGAKAGSADKNKFGPPPEPLFRR